MEMMTTLRSTGCCAVANLAYSGKNHNQTKQDKWELISAPTHMGGARGLIASTDLTSKLWGTSFRTSVLHKGGDQQKLRPGNGGPVRCKMFVPGFGEASPEAKAADALHKFFTYIAVKIVASQLQDYNKEAYVDLMDFVDRVPLKDGDQFCATLMRESSRHKNLALRIMEVRSAYAGQDFEWDNLKDLAIKHLEESNKTLMRKYLIETSNME